MELIVRELNRRTGWDEAIRGWQEERLSALIRALPSPTVSYSGQA